jgi:hypothetical protein
MSNNMNWEDLPGADPKMDIDQALYDLDSCIRVLAMAANPTKKDIDVLYKLWGYLNGWLEAGGRLPLYWRRSNEND